MELYNLSKLINSLGEDDLDSVVLQGELTMIDGVSYIVADEEFLEDVLEALIEGEPLPKVESESEKIPNKDIHLAVLNGVGDAGIAQKFAKKLIKKGYSVEETGNAGSFDYYKTILLYRPGEKAKANQFSKHVNIFKLQKSSNIEKHLDLQLIIGKDYKKIKIE